MRTLSVLGATGSIGTQALEVAARYPERFRVAALTAKSSKEKLFALVRRFRPALAGLVDPIDPGDIPADLHFCQWVFGEEALIAAAEIPCDDVLVSVVGMAGLKAVLAALAKGRRVLLANKEALVAGGALVMDAAAHAGENSLLPVDSEHSAIFQCLQAARGNRPEKLLLTCSGGPFRTWGAAEVAAATAAQALRHPTWSMGRKITVDSATLFNKALEIIEATWLFGLPPEKVQVLVHPQSVVHSGVQFADGAALCQLGTPDMRVPILYAMAFPDRLPTGGKTLDLFSCASLTFERPDPSRFPALSIVRQCLAAGGASCCVMNAANEVAVARFLQGDAPLHIIWDTVREALQHVGTLPADTLEQVLYADAAARRAAREALRGME